MTNGVAGWSKTSSGVPTCSMRPVVHDHHPVGDLEGLLLVVGDEDAGDVDLVVQRAAASAAAPAAPWRRARRTARRAAARCGSTASARASATRWRCPPESCDGIAARQRRRAAPAAAARARARGSPLRRPHAPRSHAQAEGDVLEHRHVAEQRVVLEHEADVALARTVAGVTSSSSKSTGPPSRGSRPAMMRSSVVLPEPDGPSSATQLAGRAPRGSRRRAATKLPKRLRDVCGPRCSSRSLLRAVRVAGLRAARAAFRPTAFDDQRHQRPAARAATRPRRRPAKLYSL